MSDYEDKPDLFLLCIPILIFLAGLFFIHSSSWRDGMSLDKSYTVKQIIWMIVGLALAAWSLRLDYRKWLDWAWFLYWGTVVLLIIVLFMPEKLGARRWIDLGFFNLQPSELAKISVIFTLGAVMKGKRFGMDSKKDFFLPFMIVGLPFLLILKEPDLGTSLLFIPILLTMLYVSGFRMKWIGIMGILAMVCSPVLYANLHGYQKNRILTFLNPDRDPLGSGYTIIQSKIAIGSGGLYGKGLMAGSQTQLNFLPESHTDFIFSVISEEGGFIAAGLVILGYWFIAYRGFLIAHKCPNPFGKLLATGITVMLTTQVLVNIGMTMGLLPVVGMPLFFMSYGGSSSIVSMFMIALLMNIKMRRDPFI